MKMKRFVMQFSDGEFEILREIAYKQKVSIASIIRDAVKKMIRKKYGK